MCLSLFGLPMPSTIFPLTSGLTCWERWSEMTWTTTKVEMSICTVFVSGSEISWHPIVPFLFIFFMFFALVAHWQTHKHTPQRCPIPTSFCSQYESLDSSYRSCIKCQKSARYSGPPHTWTPSQIKVSG